MAKVSDVPTIYWLVLLMVLLIGSSLLIELPCGDPLACLVEKVSSSSFAACVHICQYCFIISIKFGYEACVWRALLGLYIHLLFIQTDSIIKNKYAF